MSLTTEEYDRLLEFSAFINKDYASFYRNIGYGMDMYFHFPLTVCTIFDSDHTNKLHIDQIIGYGIYPKGLKLYQEDIWKSDLFVKRITHYRQGKMQNHVITIPDIATYDEFFVTEYGKYLKKINTPYQATLRAIHGCSRPIHVLCVFKTAEQGEFTEHELELLSKIGLVFSQSVEHYMRYTEAQFLRAFLRDEAASAQHNLAVVDEQGDAVFCSDNIARLFADCFDAHSESGFVIKIKQAVREQLHMDPFELESAATLQIRDYTVTVSKRCYTWEQCLKRFLFVYVERQDKASCAAPPPEKGCASLQKLVGEYGFTLREAEIAAMLTKGMSHNELAEALHISLPTVKFHVQNIRKKLGVSSSSAAIAKLMHADSQRRE